MTGGAVDNLRLLLDPKSGVDVALMQGGVENPPATDGLVMLASLYYEPLWIFYRDAATLSQINELEGKRMAVGVPGSGTRALADQLLEANGVMMDNGLTRGNTEIVADRRRRGIAALKAGEVDAAFFVGGAQTPIHSAGAARSGDQADEPFARRRLSAEVPVHHEAHAAGGHHRSRHQCPGPGRRDDRHQGDAGRARRLPSRAHQPADRCRSRYPRRAGLFRGGRRVPGDRAGGPARVAVRGPAQALRRRAFCTAICRSGWRPSSNARSSCWCRWSSSWFRWSNYLPQFLRWRVRSRIYRWYGELALLERDVATRKDALPIDEAGCRISIASSTRSKASRRRRCTRARPTRCASTSGWCAVRCWRARQPEGAAGHRNRAASAASALLAVRPPCRRPSRLACAPGSSGSSSALAAAIAGAGAMLGRDSARATTAPGAPAPATVVAGRRRPRASSAAPRAPSCHAKEHAAWNGSDHDLAMQVADEKSVLGDFADAKFTYAGTTSTFFAARRQVLRQHRRPGRQARTTTRSSTRSACARCSST